MLNMGISLGIIGLQLFVLGRILTPADHGLFGIVLAIQAIIQPIVEFGLGPAYIQKPKIEHYTTDVFFIINIACGLLNTIIIAILAPILSWVYEEPLLLGMLLLFAISPMLGSIGWQAKAMLMRDKRFFSLMLSTSVSGVIGVSVTIWMAFQGYSVWALCTGPVVTASISSVILLMLVRHRYRIPKAQHFVSTMGCLRFGALITTTRIINSLQNSVDKLLVGKFYSESLLGGYARSSQLAQMPDRQIRNPIGTVAMSYLCRLSQDYQQRARAYKVLLITTVIFPSVFSVTLMFMGDYLIVFVMGEQWVFAGPYIRILSICGTAMIIRGGLMTIHYCENHMKQWTMFSGLGVALGIGLPLIAAINGAPIKTFAWIISLSVLSYWLIILIKVVLRYMSVEILRELAYTAGLSTATIFLAGYGTRRLVETSLNMQPLFVKLLTVSLGTLCMVIFTQFAFNRKEVRLVFEYSKKGKNSNCSGKKE
ncbi:oligosaccharide flippase family protein [bacterium]|nr:oligosaccharide flippase family protein [bacterium]